MAGEVQQRIGDSQEVCLSRGPGSVPRMERSSQGECSVTRGFLSIDDMDGFGVPQVCARSKDSEVRDDSFCVYGSVFSMCDQCDVYRIHAIGREDKEELEKQAHQGGELHKDQVPREMTQVSQVFSLKDIKSNNLCDFMFIFNYAVFVFLNKLEICGTLRIHYSNMVQIRRMR